MDAPIRAHRIAAGLTQAELAARAGVSRQLVGAVEAGRHLPRVDAAMRLAAALGVEVADLFGLRPAAVDVVTGGTPAPGTLVRLGRIGEQLVTAGALVTSEGWDIADGIVEEDGVIELASVAPGLVVVGCEPGLGVLERMLRERGAGAVAVAASSSAAIGALAAGRTHAAVVHGPGDVRRSDPGGVAVDRYGLARWRVGLAAPADAAVGWWERALGGTEPVIQREAGAGVQATFEHATGRPAGSIPGPRVATHIEAARRAALTGVAAVTIEPAALAAGAAFHPLDLHTAELWIDRRWATDPIVGGAMDVLAGRRFQRRLAGVGGYDLTDCAVRVA